MIRDFIIVGMGGLIGSMSRYAVYLLITRWDVSKLFLATLLVNLLGCFLIGVLGGILSKLPGQASLFLIAGFCGGFTTFSTFALDGVRLIKEGLWFQFTMYATISFVGGMLLCVLGVFLANKL